MLRPTLAAALFALVGCAPTTAVVNGQRVARPTLAYTDHYYYAVTHYRAYPEQRSPSSGLHAYAGRIAGFACGADLTYEADYRGHALQLLGYVEPMDPSHGAMTRQQPAHVEVRDMEGHRYFRGSVGDDMGGLFIAHDRPSRVIDFALGQDGLWGQIGSRRFDLKRVDEDTLAGTVVITNGPKLDFELRGLAAVWSMPPADQAAIMPLMLTCSQVENGRHIERTTETTAPLLTVDFRGLPPRIEPAYDTAPPQAPVVAPVAPAPPVAPVAPAPPAPPLAPVAPAPEVTPAQPMGPPSAPAPAAPDVDDEDDGGEPGA